MSEMHGRKDIDYKHVREVVQMPRAELKSRYPRSPHWHIGVPTVHRIPFYRTSVHRGREGGREGERKGGRKGELEMRMLMIIFCIFFRWKWSIDSRCEISRTRVMHNQCGARGTGRGGGGCRSTVQAPPDSTLIE